VLLDGKIRCPIEKSVGSVFFILGGRRDSLKKMV